MTKEESIKRLEKIRAIYLGMDNKSDVKALDMAIKALEQTDGDLISRQAVLDIFGDIHPLDYNARAYVAQIKELPSAEKTAEETNLTSEELFDLDIEQNVKDIDSGEDNSYYRGRLAGMLSGYRILKGKPYEEKEAEGATE